MAKNILTKIIRYFYQKFGVNFFFSESIFYSMIMVLTIILTGLSLKQIFFLIFLSYICNKIKKIMFYCNNNSYSLKCYKRKMMLLRQKNKRLFNKIITEDYDIVRSKFLKSKSFQLYFKLLDTTRYLPWKSFLMVKNSQFYN
jgi:hypothetical protein